MWRGRRLVQMLAARAEPVCLQVAVSQEAIQSIAATVIEAVCLVTHCLLALQGGALSRLET
jgi:hypothetical protein